MKRLWDRVQCLLGWHRWFTADDPKGTWRAKCITCGEECYP